MRLTNCLLLKPSVLQLQNKPGIHQQVACDPRAYLSSTWPCSSFCFLGLPRNVWVTAFGAQSQHRRMGSFLVYFLDTKSLWSRKYCSHWPGPVFCPCCHFLGHRSHTCFWFNTSPARGRYSLPCGFDRLAEVWWMGKKKINKLTFDSLLAGHGQRQGMSGVDYMRSQGLAWLLGMLIQFWHAATVDRDLTKLPCEIRRALAFVPWAALAAIHTWKMAND